MAKRGSDTLLALGDTHFPHEDELAVAVVMKAVEMLKPTLSVSMGDLLDCSAFSGYAPTIHEEPADFAVELAKANALLDQLQRYSGRVVAIEGNHETRIDRWAAASNPGRASYSMLCPRINLSRGRKKFIYVPHYAKGGGYSHYKITPRLVAVHGWTYCKAASAKHLELAKGMSILHGHTHRAQVEYSQLPFSLQSIEGRSTGCLCQKVPLWRAGSPVQWVSGFVVGYIGHHTHTLYTVMINGNKAILPDGREVRV